MTNPKGVLLLQCFSSLIHQISETLKIHSYDTIGKHTIWLCQEQTLVQGFEPDDGAGAHLWSVRQERCRQDHIAENHDGTPLS